MTNTGTEKLLDSDNVNQIDLEDLKRLFRKANIKLTHQRLEIYREIIGSRNHPSAEEVHRSLQKRIPTLALDTVYRTLSTFTEMSMITKLNPAGDRTLFDGNQQHHHHFICRRCKTIQDVFLPDFDNSTLSIDSAGIGTIESRHIELKGLCRACAMETP